MDYTQKIVAINLCFHNDYLVTTTLYKVSSQIDVLKQEHSRGLDNLTKSSSLSLNTWNARKRLRDLEVVL